MGIGKFLRNLRSGQLQIDWRGPSASVRRRVASALAFLWWDLAFKLWRLFNRYHRQIRRGFVVSFVIVFAVYGGGWVRTHWHDPDRTVKTVNFLAAFWPFAISIFVAFLPDLDRFPQMRRAWRAVIFASGLVYSIILWQQQSVNLATSRKDQETIVTKAVTSANSHADEQIGKLRKAMTDAGEKSDAQFKEAVRRSDEQTEAVKGTTRRFEELISQSTTEIGKSISKVGKPDPPLPARLELVRCPGHFVPAGDPILRFGSL